MYVFFILMAFVLIVCIVGFDSGEVGYKCIIVIIIPKMMVMRIIVIIISSSILE